VVDPEGGLSDDFQVSRSCLHFITYIIASFCLLNQSEESKIRINYFKLLYNIILYNTIICYDVSNNIKL